MVCAAEASSPPDTAAMDGLIGARMTPGAMQLTRIPRGASSSARYAVYAATPALVAPYTEAPMNLAIRPVSEATLTIADPSASRGANTSVTRAMPATFTWNIRSMVASSIRPRNESRSTPAQLTSPVSGSSPSAAAAASTLARSVTSPSTARMPRLPGSSQSTSAICGARSMATAVDPASRSRRQIAIPITPAPPVTTTCPISASPFDQIHDPGGFFAHTTENPPGSWTAAPVAKPEAPGPRDQQVQAHRERPLGHDAAAAGPEVAVRLRPHRAPQRPLQPAVVKLRHRRRHLHVVRAPGGQATDRERREPSLRLEERDGRGAVRVGPVHHEEVGEPGHHDPEERPWVAVPHIVQVPAAHPGDLQLRQVVGGVEAGGEHHNVEVVPVAVLVDHPGGGQPLRAVRHERDVWLQQRLVVVVAQHGPLPLEGKRRGEQPQQLGVPGDRVGEELRRHLPALAVDPAVPPGVAHPQLAGVVAVVEAQPAPPAHQRVAVQRALHGGERPAVLGQHPVGLALEDLDLGGARGGLGDHLHGA